MMTEFVADVLGCGPDELAAAVVGKVCLVEGTLVPCTVPKLDSRL